MAPKQDGPPHLKPGSTVEVTSDEEGFKGSWFVAKVVKRANRKSPKYVIEYAKLFEDEEGTKPLKETVDAAQIRPVQPEGGKRVFEVGDEVDAYYNDGWWEGKVCGVVGEEEEWGMRKVEVYFDGNGERIVFGFESLRVHRVWDNGVWVPPVEEEEEDGGGDVIAVMEEEEEEEVISGEENSEKAEEEEKLPIEDNDNSDKGGSEKDKEHEKFDYFGSLKLPIKDDGNSEKEKSDKDKEDEKLSLPRTRKRRAVSPKQPETSHLKPGAAVEISSDDTGFRGSWFIGTIIRCLSKKKPAKFLVEYKTLFQDEAGKNHLRETLHEYQLRPLQPTEKRPREFKFGDEVDAYFNDGWWEGSITEEVSGGRFKVYFRPAKEQLEFGKESLRIHREWNDGGWDPPIEDEDEGTEEIEEDKKEVPLTDVRSDGDMFKETFGKGALVEVSSDEDGFRGAWFSATVIELLEKDKYVIEYTTLRTEDDSAFLREEVDSQHIRPYPPNIVLKARFKVYQEVDAFYNDAWWIGMISKILKGGSRYKVFFRDTKEELEFEHSDLRLHQDWIDGRWVVTSKDLKL